MMILCRSSERWSTGYEGGGLWRTYYPADLSPRLQRSFGALASLCEGRLPPHAGGKRNVCRGDALVTYVREGSLSVTDASGQSSVIRAGEFHLAPFGNRTHLHQANDSPRDSAHVFQIGLHHGLNVQGISPSQQQKHFNVATRRGGFHLVASPHASAGSIRLHQNVFVYSAILKEGRHVVHELSAGRLAWVQVAQGEVRLLDSTLASGDGCGVTQVRAVALTAYSDSEVLLFDVCSLPPSFATKNALEGDESLGDGASRRVMAARPGCDGFPAFGRPTP